MKKGFAEAPDTSWKGKEEEQIENLLPYYMLSLSFISYAGTFSALILNILLPKKRAI